MSSEERSNTKGRKNVVEWPDHLKNFKKGKYIREVLTFDEELERKFIQAKDERPTALRSNVVEKYIREVLNKGENSSSYGQKFDIVKKMLELNLDNRVLNQMRQTMNEKIDDERGLMKRSEFKRMLYTSFGRIPHENKKIIYDMLIQLISVHVDEVEKDSKNKNNATPLVFQKSLKSMQISSEDEEAYVSIEKLSNFIDFFNWVPFFVMDIKHKNDTSKDLYLYLGKQIDKVGEYMKELPEDEKENLIHEGRRFKKVLGLISFKIYERFKTLLSAFRYFDSDH